MTSLCHVVASKKSMVKALSLQIPPTREQWAMTAQETGHEIRKVAIMGSSINDTFFLAANSAPRPLLIQGTISIWGAAQTWWRSVMLPGLSALSWTAPEKRAMIRTEGIANAEGRQNWEAGKMDSNHSKVSWSVVQPLIRSELSCSQWAPSRSTIKTWRLSTQIGSSYRLSITCLNRLLLTKTPSVSSKTLASHSSSTFVSAQWTAGICVGDIQLASKSTILTFK